MKRLILAFVSLFTITVSASAMSYEQARDQALFLTDKMAYELNLTDEQYEAAYEINLDYLMRIDNYNDLYGAYWRQRNLDLSYILLDWQYNAYCAASYFYRPLYWDGGYWHFGIYARYPHRDYFYFGCPDFVWTYRGGHSWYMNGGRSWYHGRRWAGPRDNGPRMGMRNRFDNGGFGNGYRYEPGRRTWSSAGGRNMTPISNGNRSNGNRSFGNMQRGSVNDSPLRNRSFGSQSSSPSNARNNGNRSFGNRSFGSSTNGTRSFGTPRQSSTRSTVNQPSSSNRSFGGGSFGNHSSQPNRTFSPSTGSSQSRSFNAPSTRSSNSSSGRSFGGGSFGGHSSSGSFGGGHSNGNSGGGGSFGRR